MIHEFPTKVIISTLEKIDFSKKIYIVYSNDDFYIHNGVDTLVCLTSVFDYTATVEGILSNCKDVGLHTVAECDSMDIALDAYNLWLKNYSK